jgi:NAD(P)-dependent dehydrogenase (short-subunit alcohol dehydrogenase family)
MKDRKVALVTAGGSGMGAEIARALSNNGYAVAVLSSSGKGEALAKKLGGIGVTGSNLNVSDLKQFVDTAQSAYGRIDAVVNSAGHGPKGNLLELSDEDWVLGMNTYLMNVVRMCRLVTPLFEAAGGGVVINISTFGAFEPDLNFPISCTFRAGLAAFAKMYSNEYASKNIRMNNILPGFIDSLPEKDHFRKRIPMGRYGSVSEIAATALFLLSEGANYITGQNIRVDGGLTRSV